MSQGKCIQENRSQAKRDLDTTRMILSNKGNVEHAAFHLEQSYEKILEAVHGTYRLHIRNDDFK